MSEWKNILLDEEETDRPEEEAIQQAAQEKDTQSGEQPARRRRRSERHTEMPAAEEPDAPTGETKSETPRQQIRASETAREVANRYRQQQASQAPADRTMRIPSQSSRAAMGSAQPIRKSAEQVGYASGRMGVNSLQRARMSEEGRARLAEESQAREMRPVITERPKAEPARRPGKALVAVIAALLVIGVLLVAVLAMPEDSAFGGLRRRLSGVTEKTGEIRRAVLTFEVSGQSAKTAPAIVDFTLVTEKGVEDVRLLSEAGDILPFERETAEQEERILWELSWYAENSYTGEVRLQTLAAEEWADAEMTVRVQVLNPAEEAEVSRETEVLPAAIVTEVPPETPVPITTPEPEEDPEAEGEELEEESFGDGEAEGAGEDSQAETWDPDDPDNFSAAADPDDPGDGAESGENASAAEEPAPADEPAMTAEAQEEIAATEEPVIRPLMTVSAAESADPALIPTTVIYNGTKKVTEYARSDKEKIHMPTLGEYTKVKMGVLTWRSDAFRQNAAVGTAKGLDSLELAWTAEAGSVKGSGQTYYGIGWTGQPVIVKWSKNVREQSEMYDAKQEKSGLKEVIVAGMDGRIYFLDLTDGSATRNSIKLGFPMRGTPSVHPGGAPYMTIGQFARKMANTTGTIGLRQYNLYRLKELSLIDGLDAKNNRPYNKVGSFETSALIDRKTNTMITAGTNGLLYVINLNPEFDYNAGTYTQSPTQVVMKSKAKNESDASTAVEASVAMYDRYVYYADVGGYLRCVDTNSMTIAWAASLGDTVESTPALDWHGLDGLDLYAATELSSRKKGDAEIVCFDALSGEKRWTAAFGVKKDTKNKTTSGFKASPVIGQQGLSEYVYYTVNNLSAEGQTQLNIGDETAAIIALRKEDGSVAWAKGLSGRGYSSPVAVYDENGNGAIIQCGGDGKILMLDGTTGQEKASLQIDGAIEASPAIYDGMMVIGTSEKNKNNIYGIRIQ